MHREDPLNSVECPEGDDIGSAAFHHFFGGLENDTNIPAQHPRPARMVQRNGQCQHDRGVGIVTAGVHHSRDGGGKTDGGVFLDGEGVDVPTEGDNAGTISHFGVLIACGDVHHEAGVGETLRGEPLLTQHGFDVVGGAEF